MMRCRRARVSTNKAAGEGVAVSWRAVRPDSTFPWRGKVHRRLLAAVLYVKNADAKHRLWRSAAGWGESARKRAANPCAAAHLRCATLPLQGRVQNPTPSRRFPFQVGFPLAERGEAVHHGAVAEGALRGGDVFGFARPGFLRRGL